MMGPSKPIRRRPEQLSGKNNRKYSSSFREEVRVGRQQKLFPSQIEGHLEKMPHARTRPTENLKSRKKWHLPATRRCPCGKCVRKRVQLVRWGKLRPESIEELVPRRKRFNASLLRQPAFIRREQSLILKEGTLPPMPTDAPDMTEYIEQNPLVLKRWIRDLNRWERNTPKKWKCKICGGWNYKRLRGRNFCLKCGQIYGAPNPDFGVSNKQPMDDIIFSCRYHQHSSDHNTFHCPLVNQHRKRIARINMQYLRVCCDKNLTLMEVARMHIFRQSQYFGKGATGIGPSAPLVYKLRHQPAVSYLFI